MKLAIAGDSAGDGLARVLADHLKASHEVTLIDMDAAGAEYYANLSEFVGNRVLTGEFERAILVCGTGIGVAMSANKVRGIRAHRPMTPIQLSVLRCRIMRRSSRWARGLSGQNWRNPLPRPIWRKVLTPMAAAPAMLRRLMR